MRSLALAALLVGWAVSAASTTAPAGASAPGGGLAFTSLRGGAPHVWAVDVDGSALRPLTHTAQPAFEGSPAYSPDGTRIAYVCGNFELCVMNADGSAQARLTTNDWPREFRYDRSPAWSPDGTRIVFVRTSGRDEFWTINADGSGLRQIPVGAGFNDNPVFSPDGRTIAFDHADDASSLDPDAPFLAPHGIYVAGAGGGDARRITPEIGVDATDPAWSPDGGRIAFDRTTDGGTRIYVVNAAGGGLRRTVPRSFRVASGASWSPDGGTLAFAGGRGGAISLYAVASAGGVPRRVTAGPGPDFDPVWRPSAAAARSALPATPVPPSTPTADARVVGALIAAGIELAAGLSPDTVSDSARKAARAATALSRIGRRIRAATLELRPATVRGAAVRHRLLRATTLVKAAVAELRAAVRSLRRHDRRAARSHRSDAQLGLFGVFVAIAEGGARAGLPNAVI
jgi:Tol biopolymer transport system component